MTVWTRRFAAPGPGPRLAVKDAIDVAGVPTTMGCAAVAQTAAAATADAACVAVARRAGARVVGKTTLHELCYGVSGVNPWAGTPDNPLDPALVPGGSSSGSAVAVARDEADVALGTDTGGSVRIPAACCGVAGLKTTWGRIPLTGVGPLAPTLDTVGPLARDVAGLVLGMSLLEPGFTAAPAAPARVGRVRIAGVRTAAWPVPDPDWEEAAEAAVDAALAAWGVELIAVDLPGWAAADAAFEPVIAWEAWLADGPVVTGAPDQVGDIVRRRVLAGRDVDPERYAAALRTRVAWQTELAAVHERFPVLALPVLAAPVPRRDDPAAGVGLNVLTRTFNLAGTPALSLPLGGPGLALQLTGPAGGEDLLCAAGLAVEAALGTARPAP